ncbi:MAG: Two component regulator propeller [Bacteroidota bacterium]|nr:Two component regulator propeller [Bacteroidota bacterium]
MKSFLKYIPFLPGVLSILALLHINLSMAQKAPLGSWTAHLPMVSGTSVCQSTNNIYAACTNGVLSVNIDNGLLEKYTKVIGLAEVFVSQVGYDTATSTLVIGYANSNIDLIQNGKIVNLPYLKNAAISGDKNIYYIFCRDSIAYIGTGFGLMQVDLVKQEISETYTFNNGVSNDRVNAVWADETAIYCATTEGIVMGKIAANVNLLNFNDWVKYSSGIPASEASAITQYQNKIIAAVGNTLYQFDGTNWSVFFMDANWLTMHLNNSYGQLLIAQQKSVGGNIVDKRVGRWNGSAFTFYSGQFNIERPLQVLQDKNGELWHADLYRGLVHQQGGNFNVIAPNAPYSINCKEMDYMNGTMWVSSSAIRNGWNPDNLPDSRSFYACTNYTWTNYTQYDLPVLDTFSQIAVVKALPAENKVLFGAASFGTGGIMEFSPADKSYKIIKYAPNVTPAFRITGADVDAQGNAWFSNAYSSAPIICRKKDGTYTFFNSGFLNGIVVKDILADDYNQIWVAKESAGGGLVVLNYGNDIDDKSDDTYYNFAAGRGAGNLPINDVVCMAKDKDGVIWLGTSQGIAIVSCAGYVTENACEAEQICINRNDGSGFCDNLLEDEIINCITVDAANRKWIGTNNGIFLVSADGQKTIHYFNEINSPLLANYVRSIAINPENGDVFIGTEKGICTYRAEATSTTDNTEAPYVYPNPVRHEYDGPIAIAGIPDNCNVKIVDVSGNLVFESTALGGQATWDGRLTNGDRAATGIYFALCQGSDKKQKAKLKFLLVH